METKRPIDIVVISDVHLGTYGCRAKELLSYLKSIKPKTLILNGDIIDIWQFSKRYWPKSHMKVIRHILRLVSKGVQVYYIPGNHDETIRRFVGFKLGTFSIANKIVLPLPDDKKAWIFHGDVFDVVMQHSKWLAKLGAIGYDTLILVNHFANFLSEKILKRGKFSFSKKIKNSVKSAIIFINQFEDTAANIGLSNGYDYVICGHIHQPKIREITNESGNQITYLNSGDWIENLTALEFYQNQWTIYHHNTDIVPLPDDEEEPTTNALFNNLLNEFNLQKA